jgi:hypothetical protein
MQRLATVPGIFSISRRTEAQGKALHPVKAMKVAQSKVSNSKGAEDWVLVLEKN